MIASLTPEGRVTAAVRSPASLLVLYDADCALCRRCRAWLEEQPTYLPLRFLEAAAPEAWERLGPVRVWLGAELVVVSDRGEVWVGSAAFLMCLWATREYREWSHRLSGPALAPLAERFFHLVSSRRRALGRLVRDDCPDRRCRHRR